MVSVVRLSETYLILGKKFERAPNPTDFTYVIVPPVCKDFKWLSYKLQGKTDNGQLKWGHQSPFAPMNKKDVI